MMMDLTKPDESSLKIQKGEKTSFEVGYEATFVFPIFIRSPFQISAVD